MKCNRHSVMGSSIERAGGTSNVAFPLSWDNALGTYIATTEDAGRAGGTLNETFTEGWGVRSGGRDIRCNLHCVMRQGKEKLCYNRGKRVSGGRDST